MDAGSVAHSQHMRPRLQPLLNMQPVSLERLPRSMPGAGGYLLSEGPRHLHGSMLKSQTQSGKRSLKFTSPLCLGIHTTTSTFIDAFRLAHL